MLFDNNLNLSTISIYGEVKKKSLNENYKPINQNTLSKTKLLGEKILKRSEMTSQLLKQ